MKNKILIIFLLILSGCASLKYPNWEKVNISMSCVHNKPCVSKGEQEKCTDTDPANQCSTWFKKRATLVGANTALVDTSSYTATYFQCEAGLPPYKESGHKDLKFNEDEYKSYLKSGNNTVTGQAFLTQNGGGVVTCAGQNVLMYPDTDYFNQRDLEIAKGCQLTNESSMNLDLFKLSQCDAQGNFDFHKVPEGNYIITVNVSWNVPTVKSIGNYYYTDNRTQGGPLRKKITVQNGEINRFIISR
jgi:hypothetical protein